jgi:predicted amidohydrolase YtcJ
MQPFWAQYNGMLTSCRQHLGEQRVDRLYAIRDMLDAGVDVVFSSDWPVSSFSPIHGIAVAVHRRSQLDQEPHNPSQAVSLEEAIDAYTTSALKAFGEESNGLEVGSKFDAVILEGNIKQKDLSHLIATEVLAVYRSGNKLLPHN